MVDIIEDIKNAEDFDLRREYNPEWIMLIIEDIRKQIEWIKLKMIEILQVIQ